MKKFEEEFDKNVTNVALRQDGESVITVCDYNEAKAFGHGWVSPEDHQFKVGEIQDDLSCANEEIERLNAKLEKQQPEIPEFVAEFIEKYKGYRSLFGAFKIISNNRANNETLYDWVFAHAGRQEIFAQAWLNGYTVAKEKRFYLKHKSVLIFDPDSDDSDVEELYLGAGGNFVPYQHLAKIFTQSEIDDMAAESYERIEVEE